MDVAAFTNVAIALSAGQRELYLALADQMKREYGSRIHFYVRAREEAHGLARCLSSYDTLTPANPVLEAIDAEDLDEASVMAEAKRWEALTGTTISRLIAAHRQLNRGYRVGGYGYPRPRVYLKASYAQQVNAMVSALAFWDREITDKGITLLIDGDTEAATVAVLRGVLYRRLHHARYQNRYFWSPDLSQSNPALLDAYQATTDAVPPVRLDTGYAAAHVKIDAYVKASGLGASLKSVPVNLAWRAYMLLRGYDAAKRGMTAWEIVIGPFVKRRAFRRLLRFAKTKVVDLAATPFVYLPLQKEPEIALNQAEPELPQQQAMIISISRELPAGCLLAVKEHLVAVQSRPLGFYEQVAALPNVVFLDPFENSVEAIKAAVATAAGFGTAGLEAALLGKPVINFARRVPWSILEHVMTVRDETALLGIVAAAVSHNVDDERSRRDGARYLAALIGTSFSLGTYGTDRSASRGATPEWSWVALDGLAASLTQGDSDV